MKRFILLLFSSSVLAQSPFENMLKFSGFEWGVFTNYDKYSETRFTKDSVLIDSSGFLHLKAYRVKKDTGYKYFASGVISKKKFLYGVYRFETHGRLDDFLNTNFSPFLYDWDRGIYEIDIEFTRSDKNKEHPGNFNLHYMPDGKHYKKHWDFSLPRWSLNAVHYIYLYPDSVVLKSAVLEHGKEKMYGYYITKDKRFIPNRPVYMEIYLWWPKRCEKSENKREIIIKKVSFTPFKLKKK